MRSGTLEIRQLMEDAVPQRGGEPRKVWFARVSRYLGVSISRAESLFYHAQCRVRADEYARLLAISGQSSISRVRSHHQRLSQRQGEAYVTALQNIQQQVQELLSSIRSDRENSA